MERKFLCTSGGKFSPGVQTLIRDKFGIWASNGSSVEIWNNFKEIKSTSIERFVPHKILKIPRTLNITVWKLNV